MSQFIAKEDHERDAAFSKAMHGKSAAQKSAFLAMLNKDSKSQAVAADAYFKHWDNKDAAVETEKDRMVIPDEAQPKKRLTAPGTKRRLRQSNQKVRYCFEKAEELC